MREAKTVLKEHSCVVDQYKHETLILMTSKSHIKEALNSKKTGY